jgi:predicted RNA-binding protein with PIN domain
MTLIIDGYNLLHASGILGRGVGPGGLERSRAALLNFLVESLEPSELAGAVVVFDAREAPPGLPRIVDHRGMRVQFAEPGGDADQVIEELIRAHSAPRRLVVVSSDHRLHRAARRRRAQPIDSDQWYADVVRRRIDRMRRTRDASKPMEPLSPGEVEFWLHKFESHERTGGAGKPSVGDNPFPPGYAEDEREE